MLLKEEIDKTKKELKKNLEEIVNATAENEVIPENLKIFGKQKEINSKKLAECKAECTTKAQRVEELKKLINDLNILTEENEKEKQKKIEEYENAKKEEINFANEIKELKERKEKLEKLLVTLEKEIKYFTL